MSGGTDGRVPREDTGKPVRGLLWGPDERQVACTRRVAVAPDGMDSSERYLGDMSNILSQIKYEGVLCTRLVGRQQ